MDEAEGPGPPLGEGLIEIDGLVTVGGTEAGTTDGFYLLAENTASSSAFFEFWDMEQWTCDIHGELSQPGAEAFREPLNRLLERGPAILCIRHLALGPSFRGGGLGREVMRRMVADWADGEVGAVLLKAEPLQHQPNAYERYDDEVRDLPWNDEEQDRQRLTDHLRGWGFHLIAGTRWMVATPEALGVARNRLWPPVPVR